MEKRWWKPYEPLASTGLGASPGGACHATIPPSPFCDILTRLYSPYGHLLTFHHRTCAGMAQEPDSDIPRCESCVSYGILPSCHYLSTAINTDIFYNFLQMVLTIPESLWYIKIMHNLIPDSQHLTEL